MTHRFRDNPDNFMPGQSRSLTTKGKFNGTIVVHPSRLDIPLRRKKSTVFSLWNDLGHESINIRGKFIRSVFHTIIACREHTFLVLTKRPKRLKASFEYWYEPGEVSALMPNLWFGVTVVNQAEADEKIPILLQIPAAHRFLSLEPLLGSINLEKYFCGGRTCEDWGICEGKILINCYSHGMIHAVVLGGETGSRARPMQIEWAREIANQCNSAGVPLFVKQLHLPIWKNGKAGFRISKDIQEWPIELQRRELPWVEGARE